MAEEIDFENGRISNFQRHVTLTLNQAILAYLWCITHRPLPTNHISFESEKLSVDRRTYVRTDSEAGFSGRLTGADLTKANSIQLLCN